MDKYFKAYIKRNKLRFILMVVFLSASIATTIPIPLLTRYIIDDVLVNKDLDFLAPIVGCFVIVVVFQLIIGRLNAWLTSTFSQDFINQSRCSVIKESLYQPHYGGYDEGNLMVVINSDIPNLSQIDLTILSTTINSLVSIVAYSIMLFTLNCFLAILALSIMPLYVIWIWYIGKRMEVFNRQMQLMNEELLSSTNNIAKNQTTIVSYGFTDRVIASFGKTAEKIGSFNKKVVMYVNFAGTISLVITSIACFIPLIIGSYYVVTDIMTIGTLVVFNTYCSMLISPISSLVNLITKHKLRKVHVERIDQYLNQKNSFDEKKAETASGAMMDNDGIGLSNFKLYSGARILFSTDDFNIQKGKTVLLKGDNGTGKTLLLKSISGLYPYYEGNIFVDSTLLPKDKLINPTRGVRYVSSSQPFVLDTIEGELEENRRIPLEKYQVLLEELGINLILSNLTNGIKTSCNNLPDAINVGSMQRLRIFRALVQNPEYLLLDEVLSNIDGAHYERILGVIRKHFPDITIVIVEHHLDLHDCVDEIHHISSGGIVALSKA